VYSAGEAHLIQGLIYAFRDVRTSLAIRLNHVYMLKWMFAITSG